MTAKPSPTSRRRLGAELRQLRERVQRTAADVARELGWSEAKLSRIETARTGVRDADLDRLLHVYGVDESGRARLDALAGVHAYWEVYGEVLPDAYETYVRLEAEASSIFNYEAQVVPGLLQTTEYASAVTQASGHIVNDPDLVNQLVALRMARQAVLTRDLQPTFSAIIDEAVLRRPVGGPAVLRRQMLRLIAEAGRPSITIQVLPFAVGAHRGLEGSFVVLEFAGTASDPIVYRDAMTGGIFLRQPEDLRAHRRSFEALLAVALSPADSLKLITEAASSDG